MQAVSQKQQKYLQSEEKIISNTITLLETRRFLELKMSEVATAAECSMGAIYSHVSSKEDLLMACAAQLLDRRCEQLLTDLATIADPLDRILTVLMRLWQDDAHSPHLYNLRQLSSNPSVWQRASEARNNQLNQVADRLTTILRDNCYELITQELSQTATTQLAEQLLISIAGLSQGIYQFSVSGYCSSFSSSTNLDSTSLHLESLHILLRGWGIQRENLRNHIQAIHAQTMTQ